MPLSGKVPREERKKAKEFITPHSIGQNLLPELSGTRKEETNTQEEISPRNKGNPQLTAKPERKFTAEEGHDEIKQEEYLPEIEWIDDPEDVLEQEGEEDQKLSMGNLEEEGEEEAEPMDLSIRDADRFEDLNEDLNT